MVNKIIEIEVKIEDGPNVQATCDALFVAATNGVKNPTAFGLAKYEVVHQHIKDAKKQKK